MSKCMIGNKPGQAPITRSSVTAWSESENNRRRNSIVHRSSVDRVVEQFVKKLNMMRGNMVDDSNNNYGAVQQDAKSPRDALKDQTVDVSPSAIIQLVEDDLAVLKATTNFCRREIACFYKYFALLANVKQEVDAEALSPRIPGQRHTIHKNTFEALMADAGLSQMSFRQRLWAYFSCHGDGGITEFEIIWGLNPMLRGNIEQVAAMFFDLYDVDCSRALDAEKIAAVYSDLVVRTLDPAAHKVLRHVRRRTSLLARFSSQMHHHHHHHRAAVVGRRASLQMSVISKAVVTADVANGYPRIADLEPNPPLSEREKRNIKQWVATQTRDSNNGILSKEVFVKAIKQEHERLGQGKSKPLVTCQNFIYVMLLGLFELGPLFLLLTLSAIPDGFTEQLDITSSDIGFLVSVYFVAGAISPLLGGYFLEKKYSPACVTAIANAITAAGAFLQLLAAISPSSLYYPLLVLARFLCGFGVEITFLTTNECFLQAFPAHAGFMVGVHTFLFNLTFFLAFSILRLLLEQYNLTVTLVVVAVLCVVSVAAAIVLAVLFHKEQTPSLQRAKHSNDDDDDDKARILQTFSSLATVLTPPKPRGCAKWNLPVSFYLLVIGNKAVGYFFNTFSVFAVDYFSRNFEIAPDVAAFVTGIIGLVVGCLAPFMGFWMDKFGRRSLILSLVCVLGLVAFLILTLGSSSPYLVYICCALLAIVGAFQDLAITMISFVCTSSSQLGVGYGIYGLLGNGIDATLSAMAGYWIGNNLDIEFAWFSVSVMALGGLAWAAVYVLEKDHMSFSELPLKDVVETNDEDLFLASLGAIIHSEDDDSFHTTILAEEDKTLSANIMNEGSVDSV